MSSIVKTNMLTQALGDCIRSNPKFKAGQSYADLSMWTRLCARLSDTEIFSMLPIALRNVWADEEIHALLQERGALGTGRFNVQSLAATLVCFRRTETQNSEVRVLQSQLAHLSHEFNSLSFSVFDILKRLDRLEAENVTLKQALNIGGLSDDPAGLPKTETQQISIRSDQDAVTKYVL